jgi:hypothetical protein
MFRIVTMSQLMASAPLSASTMRICGGGVQQPLDAHQSFALPAHAGAAHEMQGMHLAEEGGSTAAWLLFVACQQSQPGGCPRYVSTRCRTR